MNIFRFMYQVRGGHTHVRMFSGEQFCQLAKCGEFVMNNDEWLEFCALANPVPSFEIVPEEVL